jgi:hypothetical protein
MSSLEEDCINYSGKLNSKGFGVAYDPVAKKKFLVIEEVWERANNRFIPDDMRLRHTCGNNLCICPDHLVLVPKVTKTAVPTTEEKAAGRSLNAAKLSEADVRTIRMNLFNESHRALGRRFRVSPATVGNIINGKTWAHVA